MGKAIREIWLMGPSGEGGVGWVAVLRIRIRDPVPFLPLDPGSGMGKKSGSGFRIQNEQPVSYFRELRNHFFGLKYLNSLMRTRY